ncbi:hypothetical protein [Natronomonas moolapensis]|nr:hypothetical protein [Natronomonas moolapensis]
MRTIVVLIIVSGFVMSPVSAETEGIDRIEHDGTSTIANQLQSSIASTGQSSESQALSVERTTVDQITITLDADVVGEDGLISGPQNVSLMTNHGIGWGDLSLNGEPENGKYQWNESVKILDERRIGENSLTNATVKIEDTELSDTVHLHTIEQASINSWIQNGQLYIPVDTVGVTNPDEVDPLLATKNNEDLEADFVDSHTVEINLNKFRDATDSSGSGTGAPVSNNFETDGVPVGSTDPIVPQIRFYHGQMVFWHPAIESETEYTITVHDIGRSNEELSTDEVSLDSGVAPLPNADRVAGAENVTLSVRQAGSDALLFGHRNINTDSEPESFNATLIDDQTIQGERSIERLNVSSIIVEPELNYISKTNTEVDGNELTLSDTSLESENTIRMATDAGIVNVKLSQSATTGSLNSIPIIPVIIGVSGIVLFVIGIFIGSKRPVKLDIIEKSFISVLIVFILSVLIISQVRPASVPGDFLRHHLPMSVVLVLPVLGYFTGSTLFHREQAQYKQSGTQTQTHTVQQQVNITDGAQPIKQRAKITARKTGDANSTSRTSVITGGSGSISLPTGKWTISAKIENEQISSETVQRSVYQGDRGPPIELTVNLPEISITVQDSTRDFRVPDAKIQLESDQEKTTKRSGEDGRVTFDSKLGQKTVGVTVSHEKYEKTTNEYQVTDNGLSETVTLKPQTGKLRVVSQIDGVETENIDAKITPEEPILKGIYGEQKSIKKAGQEGEYAEGDILIGQYRVGLELSDRLETLFKTTEKRVTVSEHGETVVAEASFDWHLSESHHDRIRRLREEIQGVTAKSGIDTAIQRYYASVINQVLDEIEQFPKQGHYFVRVDSHPDEVTDATLEAVANAVETISEAMSTKRNLDLFTACSDMVDANTQWQGTFDMETFANRLQAGPVAARRTFAEQVDDVSARIDSERGSLSEIAPAQEMLERIEISDSGKRINNIASIHLAILLLSAVEELFEHRELRERLSRTVF